jgi:MFS family permease
VSSATSSDAPGTNEKVLFWASFFTLIAAGIGFSVRGFILKDWGSQFGFTQSELGGITGGGLIGFGVAIIFFSFFADRFGYGKLMLIAFLLHASSAIVTFAATPIYGMYGKEGAHWCLIIGMWLFALGNGTCEAVINPLTATLFSKNKTHWLNILHAGWPLGLILGSLIVLGFKQVAPDVRWEIKLGVFLVPVLLYGFMMFGRKFPTSEAKASGVSTGTMIVSLLSPILLFLFVLHALVGYVELGTDSWIGNITDRVLSDETKALYAFIWTNALMFTLRFFAGPIVEKINPVGLLFVSAVLGTAGLYMLGQDFTNATWPWIGAITVYGLGKTFYWPTLLGVISERFPKGGALALGISGGIGMICAGLLGGPGIGYKQDYFAVDKIKQTSPAAYDRYKSDKPDGFPILTGLMPDKLPAVAGLDNAKLKVFDDYGTTFDDKGARKKDDKTGEEKKLTVEVDLATVARLKSEGKTVEEKLEKNLNDLKKWWDETGVKHYAEDKEKLQEARLYGAKMALLYTAGIPAALAIGFLLLILYFAATGGYKQVHLEAATPEPASRQGAPHEDWGK